MAATDPQDVVFWDEDAGPRLFFSGHWYRFIKRIKDEEVPERWVYVPERPSARSTPEPIPH